MLYERLARAGLLAALLLGACGIERPVHPMRLDGFPGAPIEEGLFELRDGASWTFRDRLDPEGSPLRLSIERRDGGYVLKGMREAGAGTRIRKGGWEYEILPEAGIAIRNGYLELDLTVIARPRDAGPKGGREQTLKLRPLKLQGLVGDSWPSGGDACTAFGYDDLRVLGERRRALVVATERGPERNLQWFAKGVGWARIRTERNGKVVRDALLVSHEPGSTD
jgi:hypothetical protein